MKKAFYLFLLCHAPLVVAENTHDCVYLEINLLNQSNQTCQLIDSHIAHGKLSDESEIPQTLTPEQLRRFYLRQTHFGPDVILTYRCGNNEFKIESQQNLCLFSAGSVNAKVLESRHLKLSYQTKKGSSWGGHPGEVHWTIG